MSATENISLSLKQAMSKMLALFRIEAEQKHNKLQDEIDTLKSDTSITFGEVIGGFDSDVMTAFANSSDTTNISTFTTSTPLTSKQAVSLSLEISQFQANQDHAAIQAAIEAANDSANVTNEWIKSQFANDVVQIYVDTYEENFKLKPEKLLTILQADETLSPTFEGYSAKISGNIISLTKEESDSYTFIIAENNLSAEGAIGEDTYNVDYKAATVTKVEI